LLHKGQSLTLEFKEEKVAGIAAGGDGKGPRTSAAEETGIETESTGTVHAVDVEAVVMEGTHTHCTCCLISLLFHQ